MSPSGINEAHQLSPSVIFGVSKADELGAWGFEVQAVQADLVAFEGVEKLYGAIRSAGRPVNAICVNAGIGSGRPFVETDLQKELELINLNVTSVVHLTKRRRSATS